MESVPVQSTISAQEYFAIEAVNQSLLKEVLRSPSHASSYLGHTKKATNAMQLGTAVHSTLLNADNFDNEVIVQPDINRRTKDGKVEYEKFLAKSKGKAVITREQAVHCMHIANSISRSREAMSLIGYADTEQSFLWKDETTALTCKARIDAIHPEDKKVVDLKTTADASPHGFARSVMKFGYHIQAAFYLRAASGLTRGIDAIKDGWQFYIVAIETSQPYAVACYKLDQRAIIEGDKMIDKALTLWAEATLLDEYSGYPDVITTLSLPEWALTEDLGNKGESL
tara:strand:- start:2911 stop:3762 length:852 start_codon:yes stop_codon:yes gene_type:complete